MNWNLSLASRTGLMRRSAVRELLKVIDQPEMISFAGGLPAAELFPVEEIREAADRVLAERGPEVLQYAATEGITPLRDWVAKQFSHNGFPVTRKNVLIVSGAQQALHLLGQVFLEAGDRVVVENPTYLALLSAWRPTGVEFLPVVSDEQGMCVAELDGLAARRPKLIYCVPNFQNPQGTTLSEARRMQLLETARQQGIGLIEDNPYGELRYSGEPLPHLFELAAGLGYDPAGFPVVHVGTFSKVLAPGLRVGWVVAAEPVIDILVRAKQAMDLHTSTLTQWLVYETVRDGLLERHLPILLKTYRERRDAMLGALRQFMPDGVSWTEPAGGMFLLVRLPGNMDAKRLLELSLAKKVAFVPGEEFHLDGAGVNTLRLNFTNAQPARIQEGVRRLAEAVGEQMAQG